MNVAFADSYYFIALLSPSDKNHHRVEEFARNFTGQLVTTSWVLTELADGFRKPPGRERVGTFIERLRQHPAAKLVRNDDDVFSAAWRLYRDRPDKDWSLTDCTSFVVMQREGLTEALTGDRHFEQAGFTILFP